MVYSGKSKMDDLGVSHELETSISKYIPHRQDIQQSLHQAKGIICT